MHDELTASKMALPRRMMHRFTTKPNWNLSSHSFLYMSKLGIQVIGWPCGDWFLEMVNVAVCCGLRGALSLPKMGYMENLKS